MTATSTSIGRTDIRSRRLRKLRRAEDGPFAVRQAKVAATNLAAEIEGHEPPSHYDHEMRLVIDESGSDSIYLHKDICTDQPATVRQGRFWSWAKRAQQRYWEISHS